MIKIKTIRTFIIIPTFFKQASVDFILKKFTDIFFNNMTFKAVLTMFPILWAICPSHSSSWLV